MKHALVTGGAGFLGSHVAEALLGRGYAVTVLDDLSGGFADNVPPGARFIQGSITDQNVINQLFASQAFEYVFHLAAYAAEGLSHFIKRFNYTNNVLGSVNLINACVNYRVSCIVFSSSIAVYGTPSVLPVREEEMPSPEDSYGIAKWAVEQELRISQRLFGLDYVIFRPHNVFGERQNIGDKYRNVAGIFMNQILQDKPLTIFGDGSQTRAFTYVGDVAPIIAESTEVPEARNETFNIGADHPYTLCELAERVAVAMGAKARLEFLPERQEVLHTYASHAKLEQVFGRRKTTPLEEGLARMAAWARAHGARSSRRFENIEIQKGLPAVWRE
jgi:UDP-glucose 4-epimerase